MDLSHKPVVPYHASILRMDECHRSFESRDHVLAAYLSGVAVECILQALALSGGSAHDARHDLSKWLAKSPVALQESINADARAQWSQLVSPWDNGIRYFSDAGFLGYVRDKGVTRGIAGGPDSQIREVARRLRDSADITHKNGVKQWLNFTRKS